jgi:hypothetical protein
MAAMKWKMVALTRAHHDVNSSVRGSGCKIGFVGFF